MNALANAIDIAAGLLLALQLAAVAIMASRSP